MKRQRRLWIAVAGPTGMAGLAALCIVLGIGSDCSADDTGNVTGYRWDWTGVFTNAVPVTEWDLASKSNVLWKTRLPEWGHSSPIVVNGRLFVNSEPQTLLCIDPETGAILWQREANVFDVPSVTKGPRLKEAWRINWSMRREADRLKGEIAAIKKQLEGSPDNAELKSMLERLESENKTTGDELGRTWLELNKGFQGFRGAMWGELLGFTTATPVSDGRFVYVKFGTGVVAAFDMDGNCKWMVESGFDPQATNASSPIIQDGRLIVHRKKTTGKSGVRGGTFTVCALDLNTGAIVWETPPLSVPDWGSGSSLQLRVGSNSVVVTHSGDAIRSSDGAKLAYGLWGKNVASATGPILAGSLVVMSDDSDGGKTNGCIRACIMEAEGEVFRWKEAWKTPVTTDGTNEAPAVSTVSTNGVIPRRERTMITSAPVYANDRIYAVEERGFMWVLDAKTGRPLEAFDIVPPEHKKPKIVIWSPLTVAGMYLYVCADGGLVFILELGKSTRLVSVCRVEDKVESAPIFWRNRMYLRAKEHLLCIGRPKGVP